MELILTGQATPAADMERLGVVNRVVPAEQDVLAEALQVADAVAQFSAPAIGLAKQAVKAGECVPWNASFGSRQTDAITPADTTTLTAGLEIERALYYSSFSLSDCREGIAAFLEKRPATFQHR